MPKKYLVGVGTVRAFQENKGLVFQGKTLISTSIDISASSNEIRGGEGNSLLAMYFNSGNMNVEITDAQFSLPLIALNVGSDIQTGAATNAQIFKQESVTLNNLTGTLTTTPAAMSGSTAQVYIEYNGNYYTYTASGTSFTVNAAEIPANSTICVAYLVTANNSDVVDIPSNIVPQRVHLYITANLVGDTTGRGYIGTETIEIPIFQLSGNQTISMSADGVANTPISGNCIAYTDGTSCVNGGRYARVIETLEGSNWYDGVSALAIAGGDFSMAVGDADQTLRVYATKGTQSFLVNNADLTFTSATAAKATVGQNTGVVHAVASGSSLITVKITAKQDIEASCTVTVTA